MGKKSRNKRLKKISQNINLPIFSHMDEDGLHALIPGEPPSDDKLKEMTKKHQENIRNSPLWGELLRIYGKEKAEELLLQFRIEIRK
jgi:hypothetical protein